VAGESSSSTDFNGTVQVTKMLYKPYWHQWCADTLELTSGLAEALQAPHQATASPLAVTFERWFLELKVGHPQTFSQLLCVFCSTAGNDLATPTLLGNTGWVEWTH